MPYKDPEKRRINSKKRYLANKEHILSKAKEKREQNKERDRERSKIYYQKNKDKRKEYRMANREMYNKWERESRKNNPLYRFKKNFRTNLKNLIKSSGSPKSKSTSKILGIDIMGFREYLESNFEPWMSWDNYGLYKKDTFNYGWDIDHIIPSSSAKTLEEMYQLNHYTNLRPLCSKVNRDIKKNKM